MAHAPQEVVLDLAQSAELFVLVLDLVEQLGIPDRDADLARVQVKQGLIGALPGLRRGEARQEQPEALVAGAQLGADRDRDARDAFVGLDAVRIDEPQLGGDEAECVLGIAGGPLGHRGDAVARLGRLDGRQDEPELSVAAFGVAGQAIVALSELGEDVTADDRDRLAHVAGRDARHGGRDLAQRSDEVQPDHRSAQDSDRDGDREHEQEQPLADLRIERADDDQQHPEDRERDDRRGQKRQVEPGLEGEGDTTSRSRFRGWGHAKSSSASGALAAGAATSAGAVAPGGATELGPVAISR